MLNLPIILLLALAGAAGAHRYGARRWNALTEALRGRLEAARLPVTPEAVDFRELEGLPAPVARYFRAALQKGAPMVAGAHARHEGTFDMGEGAARWKRFTSEQKVVTRRPGFDWDARIRILPGVAVQVHDAYVAGEGVLRASVLGLYTVMDMQGTGELAEGELMRFLAEAAWYPTALLPSQGVQWEAVDARSADAVLVDGGIRLAIRFTFDEEGLISTARAEARARAVDGELVPTPWRGRFWDYAERGGMRVPLSGAVAWLLPEGPRPYWRGRLTAIEYEPGG